MRGRPRLRPAYKRTWTPPLRNCLGAGYADAAFLLSCGRAAKGSRTCPGDPERASRGAPAIFSGLEQLVPDAGAMSMTLTEEEQALRAGESGRAAQWAIEHQIKVGAYLGASEFVPVTQADVMADTESLGVAGVEWLERMAALPADERRVRIPTITDPRGTDFAAAHRLRQQPWMLELEHRAIAAFEALGVLMTNTCINYQTIMPPLRGEHVAYGDTGVVIYSNRCCRC